MGPAGSDSEFKPRIVYQLVNADRKLSSVKESASSGQPDEGGLIYSKFIDRVYQPDCVQYMHF